MKTKALYPILLSLILSLWGAKGYSQIVTTPPNTPGGNSNLSRPSDVLDVPEVDGYVTSCYDLYDQTNSIQSQLNTIEQETIVKKLTESEVSDLDTQMKNINGQLLNLKTVGLQLAQSSGDMSENAAEALKNKPLKIPSAVIRVKNATKAVKISLQKIDFMLTVTVVNINNRLHPKAGADTAKTNLAVSGKTNKTVISITGAGFDTFNSLFTEIGGMTGIKSASKKFKATGKSQIDIVHYGTTDELLNAMLSNCKDIITEKNISGTEKGKISLAF